MPGQPSILIAIDNSTGKRYLIKLLAHPELVTSAPESARNTA